ncbi:hypothetical protein ACEQ6A_32225 [Rhizobium brockwellii]|uniref:hypothetical protein n=1 Tax=Rhizobium brockwellii TaxID=3019932 RepID=UPI003F9591A6
MATFANATIARGLGQSMSRSLEEAIPFLAGHRDRRTGRGFDDTFRLRGAEHDLNFCRMTGDPRNRDTRRRYAVGLGEFVDCAVQIGEILVFATFAIDFSRV